MWLLEYSHLKKNIRLLKGFILDTLKTLRDEVENVTWHSKKGYLKIWRRPLNRLKEDTWAIESGLLSNIEDSKTITWPIEDNYLAE
jgi:hypothetical protein